MPPPYRWVILAVCTLSFIQVHIHRLAFSPLVPTFVANLGITYAAAGAIQTAYFWTYTLVQVPIGVFTDRWGARRVMLVFMTALSAPYVMVIEMFPRELAGTAMGVINASCFAGAMVLPVILGRVADLTGSFPAAFLVAGGVQALALISGCFVRESAPARRRPSAVESTS